jgi:hypothetical protein
VISAPRLHSERSLGSRVSALGKALLFASPLSLLTLPEDARAGFEQTSGVNLTASEGIGARHQGMAVKLAGFQPGADAVVNAPAAMNDVNDFTFSTSHAEQFGLARFDNFALLVPWHADGTLGFGFSRYAVSGIDLRGENDALATDPDATFYTADWMLTGSFARRFGGFDVGGSLHLLHRAIQHDQSGLGLRGDVMAQYTMNGWEEGRRYRVGAHVRGLLPSTTRWEEGLTEYEAPEASLFAAAQWPVPYFYGTLQAGFETPGILQPGARSAAGLEGERGVTDPGSVLRTSKVGAEFNFNFGLSLRGGFDEIGAPGSTVRLGMGYAWRNILAVDYAFAAHPFLDESHRVALRFTPAFPNFEGRGFRPRPEAADKRRKVPEDTRSYPSPYVPGQPRPEAAPEAPEEEELEEGEMQEIIE